MPCGVHNFHIVIDVVFFTLSLSYGLNFKLCVLIHPSKNYIIVMLLTWYS